MKKDNVMPELVESLQRVLSDTTPSEIVAPDAGLGVRELWSYFAAKSGLSKAVIAEKLSASSGLPICSHPERESSAIGLAKLSMSQTLSMGIIPIQRQHLLTIVTADPFAAKLLTHLGVTGRRLNAHLCSHSVNAFN